MTPTYQRQKTAQAVFSGFRFEALAQLWAVFDEPLHAPLEAGQMVDQLRVQGLHGEKRDEADHGTHFERKCLPVREMQHVVIKAIPPIPKLDALAAEVVHRMANIDK